LKHPWSSTLRIEANGRLIREEDLFSEQSVQDCVRLNLDRRVERLRLTVRASPRSKGSEAWIRSVMAKARTRLPKP
jgi:hypothetical protein